MTAANDTPMPGVEERFEEVLAAYLEASDAGWAPSRRAFLERYPAWRDRLEGFFTANDAILALTRPVAEAKTGEATVLLDGEGQGEPLPRAFGDDYELVQVIGRGGMGVVYKAKQKSLGRVVALKMILPSAARSDSDVQRFRNEADAAARMDHPNIVPIYEVGESEGRPFFSMKMIDGGNLSDHADRFRTRPAEAAALVEKVARAVHHAHQRGIIHRDLKPGNILIDEQGEPLVTDFGLARQIEVRSDLTQSGAILGTPSYMAPEQASGRTGVTTTAVDVYALGTVLYEMLTGQPAFKADNALETLLQVREQRPIAPRIRNSKVPRDLETICLKCLEKDPLQRYASAADLADDLKRFQAGEVIHGRRAGVLERLVKWTWRRPALAAGSVLTLVVLALLLVSIGALGQLNKLEMARQDAARIATSEQSARHLADNERQAAEQSRAEAVEQRFRAQTFLQQTQRALYFNSITRAHLAWQNRERDQAALALDSSPAALRGWEWKLVDHLVRPQSRTLSGHTAAVLCVSCSKDGALVASGGEDRSAIIWDAKTGKVLHPFPKLPAAATSVAFSPDSKRLACGVENGVRLWDASTGKAVGKLDGAKGTVRDVKYSPDGAQVATADNDGGIRLYEATSGKFLNALDGHDGAVYSIAFSPDGGRLVSGGRDGTVRLWTLGEKPQAVQLEGHRGAVLCVAFSPKGDRIASAGNDRDVRIADAKTGQALLTLRGHNRPVAAVAFSAGGDELASGDWDGRVKMWSPMSGMETRSLPAQPEPVLSLAFSPTGWLCSGDEKGHVVMTDLFRGARVVELAAGKLTLPTVFSPVGRLGTGPGGLHDLRTGAVVLPLDDASHAAFSPDGQHLALARVTFIQVWDIAQKKEVMHLPGSFETLSALAIGPEGGWLAVGKLDRGVRLYDRATGRPHHLLTAPAGCIGLTFSPDGKSLCCRSKDTSTVTVWDAATGRERFTLQGHLDEVKALRISPDGKTTATASADRTARLWDAATGKLMRTLSGHGDAVQALAFSPDGSRIATASGDRTVRLWDVQLGAEVLTLKDHGSAIDALAFSADGQRLIAGKQGAGRVQVWEVPGR